MYYEGSEEDWNNISIDEGNDHLLDDTIHYNQKLVTKEELNEVADSIRRWSAGMHYEIGDTVLVKYGSVDKMFRCIVEHTSDEDGNGKISQEELDTNWQEIFQAARAERDSEGNKISSTYLKSTVASNILLTKKDAANTYATKDLLMNCNIIKLNKKLQRLMLITILI